MKSWVDNAIVKPPVEQFGHLLLPLDGNKVLTGELTYGMLS